MGFGAAASGQTGNCRQLEGQDFYLVGEPRFAQNARRILPRGQRGRVSRAHGFVPARSGSGSWRLVW